MWQRIMAAVLEARGSGSYDEEYLDGLLKTGEFFISRMLPRADALEAEIRAGAKTLMAMSAEQF
jgi:hypothetical protein